MSKPVKTRTPPPASAPPDPVEALLAERRAVFITKRREDLQNLRKLLEDTHGKGDFKALHDIGLIGHRLAGVGALYGFDEVSDLGRAIEAAATGQRLSDLPALFDKLSLALSAPAPATSTPNALGSNS
jgi:hypothetical protein